MNWSAQQAGGNSNSSRGSTPSQTLVVFRFVMIVIYSCCVGVGVVGNGGVALMILRIIASAKRLVFHVYLYVLALSLVDMVFTLSGVFSVTFMVLESWPFGDALCKLAYGADGFNKTFSVYLLVILSADRYLAICHPANRRFRSVGAAGRVLAAVFLPVCLTQAPIYVFAGTSPIPCQHQRRPNADTCGHICSLSFRTYPQRYNATYDDAANSSHDRQQPRDFGVYYTCFLLIFYFLIPAVLICFFYVHTLLQVRHQNRRMHRSSRRRQKVTRNVALVVAFYFFCWIPYWFLQAAIQLTLFDAFKRRHREAFIALATSIYTLPYINSAVNPLFYAYLNQSLTHAYAMTSRRQRQQRQLAKQNVAVLVEERLRGVSSPSALVNRTCQSRVVDDERPPADVTTHRRRHSDDEANLDTSVKQSGEWTKTILSNTCRSKNNTNQGAGVFV